MVKFKVSEIVVIIFWHNEILNDIWLFWEYNYFTLGHWFLFQDVCNSYINVLVVLIKRPLMCVLLNKWLKKKSFLNYHVYWNIFRSFILLFCSETNKKKSRSLNVNFSSEIRSNIKETYFGKSTYCCWLSSLCDIDKQKVVTSSL